MEKIRKGNDIEIQWAIYVGKGFNEVPYDLTGKNLTLYLKDSFGLIEVEDYSVQGNIISFVFWGKDQKRTCIYSITLVENEGMEGMHTVDECEAFSLVNHSCETGGESEGRVECIHLQFRANMGVFTPTLGGEIEVDDALSLESENPVQNKVITLALQNEIKRATDAETRLERSFDNYDKKIELIEDSVEILDKTIQQILVQNELIETRLELVNEKLDGVDLDAVANVLTKVETIETNVETIETNVEAMDVDLTNVKKSVDDLVKRVNMLHADVETEGSVDNKIANALGWEEIQ